MILALSVTYWPWFARLVYAEVRALQERDLHRGGDRARRPAVAHRPAARAAERASPIIVRTSIGMGFTILTAAALGFLGLGAPPPAPEWGRMISEVARIPARGLVVRAGAGPRHLPGRDGLQPAGRRPARRPRSAASGARVSRDA